MFHNKKYLSGYIDGQLKEKELKKLEKHLRKCKKCSAELLSLQKLKKEMSIVQQEKIPEIVLLKPSISNYRLSLTTHSVPVYETLAYKFGIAFFLNGFMIKFDSFSNTWVAILGLYTLLNLVLYLNRLNTVKRLGFA